MGIVIKLHSRLRAIPACIQGLAAAGIVKQSKIMILTVEMVCSLTLADS